MRKVCFRCHSANIEAGEAGRRDRCAECGGLVFVSIEPKIERTLLKFSMPSTPVPNDQARHWFELMHKAVDEVKS